MHAEIDGSSNPVWAFKTRAAKRIWLSCASQGVPERSLVRIRWHAGGTRKLHSTSSSAPPRSTGAGRSGKCFPDQPPLVVSEQLDGFSSIRVISARPESSWTAAGGA